MSPGARLRSLIAERGVIEAMAAHNPLSARLAVEAGFEAVWASGFELAASECRADVGLVSPGEHLELCRRMAARAGALLVADLDTGFGNAVNLSYAVRDYEAAGVAAVVFEDKTFPKMTSLASGSTRQDLAPIEECVGKVAAARGARRDEGLVIVARTEALIAGAGLDEAVRRGEAYAEAGCDLLLIHSKAQDAAEVLAFCDRWKPACPLVVVPTTYPRFGREAARAVGKIAMVIYGNHGLRAATAAMESAFRSIREAGHAAEVEPDIAPLSRIFELQDMDHVAELERRFLR
ncbi:isocitrate lyase/phosphoenolpyruvate mutase family protein [Brevundimonas sp. 2R-24]|uniref:Isocitrate lyase/phosphoenolpyruvate mutase family protein n=1 Tax=Peiella sedimenti TaxID=3061083 RepID=A0ABT8SKZ9_9CAUL|nr:isocitrate lyase/phosphoenolpyruvate mutase family protein [Caulobacteraceae bacterium XZ-24]